MNESADSKKSMERAMVEAIGLLALADAPAVPSSFKVRGHDRVTLGHDVGAEGRVIEQRVRQQGKNARFNPACCIFSDTLFVYE